MLIFVHNCQRVRKDIKIKKKKKKGWGPEQGQGKGKGQGQGHGWGWGYNQDQDQLGCFLSLSSVVFLVISCFSVCALVFFTFQQQQKRNKQPVKNKHENFIFFS